MQSPVTGWDGRQVLFHSEGAPDWIQNIHHGASTVNSRTCMKNDLHRWTARHLAQQVSERHVSATEVAQAMLARAVRLQPQLNAFADLDPSLTLAAAQDVDARLAAGE